MKMDITGSITVPLHRRDSEMPGYNMISVCLSAGLEAGQNTPAFADKVIQLMLIPVRDDDFVRQNQQVVEGKVLLHIHKVKGYVQLKEHAHDSLIRCITLFQRIVAHQNGDISYFFSIFQVGFHIFDPGKNLTDIFIHNRIKNTPGMHLITDAAAAAVGDHSKAFKPKSLSVFESPEISQGIVKIAVDGIYMHMEIDGRTGQSGGDMPSNPFHKGFNHKKTIFFDIVKIPGVQPSFFHRPLTVGAYAVVLKDNIIPETVDFIALNDLIRQVEDMLNITLLVVTELFPAVVAIFKGRFSSQNTIH